MYKIKEFAAMTGLSQSKIRFYEKHGLLLSNRQENGYRVFTPEDAFKSNAFRVLLQYGFSIDEAIKMLDAKQGTEEFEHSLKNQYAKLTQEADLIAYRLRRINDALDLIDLEPGLEFSLMDAPDQVYVSASVGRDFTPSLENEKTLAEFYSLLSITSCARILKKADFDNNEVIINPSYIITMPEQEKYRLSEESLTQVEYLYLGKCIRYQRTTTRNDGVKRKTFQELMSYLEDHGYQLRSDLILFPSFLNLDGQGSDVEILYVPIK